MKRRVLLGGLGTASISVGAAFGSGAFTSIEADRAVELNVNNDSNAQIIFRRNADAVGANRLIRTTSEGTGTDDSNNGIEVIEFSQTDLNEQSKTTFEDALEIKNNTDQNGGPATDDSGLDATIYVVPKDKDGNFLDQDVLDFLVGGSTIVAEGTSDSSTKNETQLNTGNKIIVDIEVDLRGDGNGNDLDDINQVTFVVDADE
ncbi:hypothetical protein [Halorubrum sp. PV6]|uniref:hypothetical protein n=1 Tax=Halorubrum sp. PV6 TaxID=634157 RepID=UPI0011988335|nr:hypothetical protein [Halorubrum sp. PV6]AZQ16085.1 hypothetical protein DOS48_14570 [Halorubrum sp. PV6]